MNWEETIHHIRSIPEYRELVEVAYLEDDLVLNVERFQKSAEFKETLSWIKKYHPSAKKILDIGCGNGTSSVALCLAGYEVTAVEPDPSQTVGTGAIHKLKDHYQLSALEIFQAFAEDIEFPAETFDIVYVRQAMHHANDLNKFIAEASRVLKPNGILFTIRDHVVFDEADKEWFLKTHLLHHFYGGENAFSPGEYRSAIKSAGLELIKEFKSFDTPINYFPLTEQQLEDLPTKYQQDILARLSEKTGFIGRNKLVQKLYLKLISFNPDDCYNENRFPGRMYSYIASKS